MARRGGTLRFGCQTGGCKESALVPYDTQAEARETTASTYYKTWRCTRHANTELVLGPDNTARRHVMVVTEQKYGHYWADEGAAKGSMGLVDGPGFKAFARDFPPGTRLVVTAYIETPEQAAIVAEQNGETS